jgi:glyoxylase I family protein
MAAIGLNHFNLQAHKELLEQLKDFYCDYLGLQVGERPQLRSFGYWLYAEGKAILHLSESAHSRQTHIRTTIDHVAFTCVDAAHMEQKLRAGGIEFEVRGGAGLKQIFLADPAGNGVELNFSGEEV